MYWLQPNTVLLISTLVVGSVQGLRYSTWVKAHNTNRAKFGARPLQIAAMDLREETQKYADLCQFNHSERAGYDYGENLAAVWSLPDRPIQHFGPQAMHLWMEEAAKYAEGNMTAALHFSQVVWKDTTHVACAATHCEPRSLNQKIDMPGVIYVCRYWSVGNVQGAFEKNVAIPLGKSRAEKRSKRHKKRGERHTKRALRVIEDDGRSLFADIL